MKIIIDNSNLFVGGGIQVATSFINDLKAIKNQNEYVIIQSPNSSKEIDITEFPQNFRFFTLTYREFNSKRLRSQVVKKIEKEIRPNVIFTVFGPSFHKSEFPKVVGFAIPFIIYPNSPFFSKISFFHKLKYKSLAALKTFLFKKNSDALIFESESARRILQMKLGKTIKTYCVNNSLNEIFLKKNKWKSISLHKKSNFNILCLSANYPHKNLSIIPYVIESLVNEFEFEDFTFHVSLSKNDLRLDTRFDRYINYLGKVNLDEVPLLYKEMNLLFMPTLLEVFSTTYLEAMSMGLPIVASDMDFSRYVCGDAALFCAPLDGKDYAEKIMQLYNDRLLRESLISRGKDNLSRFGTSLDRTIEYLKILTENAKN